MQKPNAASSSPNPKTGEDGPFSGIVEELRKSVGELQMTLYSRDNTIRGLNEKVAKITKRAEQVRKARRSEASRKRYIVGLEKLISCPFAYHRPA